MICAIMQPHFFPWIGYFNLINKVDKFIFLDDAQYSKSSWHNRNRILINNNINFISVPLVKSELDTKINQKMIVSNNLWKKKLIKSLRQNFSNHPFFNDLSELLDFFNAQDTQIISDLNIEIIKFICNKLNIKKVEFLKSSKFKINLKRTEKILKLLDLIKAKEYLSVQGTKEYLHNDNFKKYTDIKLTFNNFKSKKYSQKNSKSFQKNLSILDLIANQGWEKSSKFIID